MSAAKAESSAAEPISVRIPEAVRLTGLSRSRLYELMKSGDIAFAKVGGSTLIIVESLRRFVVDRIASQPESGGNSRYPNEPQHSIAGLGETPAA